MFRNTSAYHRLWYVKKRNARRVSIYFKLFSFIIILFLLYTYAQKSIFPIYIKSSEVTLSHKLANQALDAALDKAGSPELYQRFIQIQRNENGGVDSIEINTAELGRISDEISSLVKERVSNTGESSMIELKELPGNPITFIFGRSLDARIIPGSFKADLTSKLSKTPDGQIKIKTEMHINATAKLTYPIFSTKTEIKKTLPISEVTLLDYDSIIMDYNRH